MIKLNMSSLLNECEKLCEERQYEDIYFKQNLESDIIKIKKIVNKKVYYAYTIGQIRNDGCYLTYDGGYNIDNLYERTNLKFDNSKLYESVARIIFNNIEKACAKEGMILRRKDNTDG